MPAICLVLVSVLCAVRCSGVLCVHRVDTGHSWSFVKHSVSAVRSEDPVHSCVPQAQVEHQVPQVDRMPSASKRQ